MRGRQYVCAGLAVAMAAALLTVGAWARAASTTDGTGGAEATTRGRKEVADAPVVPGGRGGTTRPREDGRDRSWPVPGEGRGATRPLVLRGWEPPATGWGPGHRGVDLATRSGGPVYAAAAGRVVFAGTVAGRGVVSIELTGTTLDRSRRAGDASPLRTTFEPVRASVVRGDRVRAGERVGTVESGPFHCGDACLHWGLLRGEHYLDPLALLPPRMLSRGPSRLLPFLGRPLPERRADPRGWPRGGVSRALRAVPSTRLPP
ncbi:M23 family metallopeptidase [Streptomyces sp. N2-109]|uniref:M23 family metallopeptidase n=1 Tax=Streptomyces gossypii TaxID=2883101 RepID=A0ABT2K3L6_9ACTN|nr:M23 family metallopeptidase [Streptomyces gossypii]MCT2594214.1 M23 family metallopeptidase [Streptomyces gossypii]